MRVGVGVVERAKKKEGKEREVARELPRRVSPVRRRATDKGGKEQPGASERGRETDEDSERIRQGTRKRQKQRQRPEAEAAAVAAAVPGHQGTVVTAQAPLDVPGAGCTTKRG